jgi:hypothetical protein
MTSDDLYAIVEYNQASHRPYVLHGPYDDRAEADQAVAVLRGDNRARGRRETFTICVLEEVDDGDDPA